MILNGKTTEILIPTDNMSVEIDRRNHDVQVRLKSLPAKVFDIPGHNVKFTVFNEVKEEEELPLSKGKK